MTGHFPFMNQELTGGNGRTSYYGFASGVMCIFSMLSLISIESMRTYRLPSGQVNTGSNGWPSIA